MNIAGILEKIPDYDVISFDVYDTLIFRDVSKPTDIFEIVDYVYHTRHIGQSPIAHFKNRRIEAEKCCRQGRSSEVTLDEIYKELKCPESMRRALMETEIEVEIQFVCANAEICKALNYAKSLGKTVVIISDMYLPGRVIERVLDRCHIRGYDALFVSSEHGFRKRDGSLFRRAIDSLGCSPGSMLHIGDNANSDFKQARKRGIEAVLYLPRKPPIKHYVQSPYFNMTAIQNNAFLAFCSNREAIEKHPLNSIGYSLLGLPLYSFCYWLHDQTQDKHKFFLSRDGHLIMRAYLQLFPREAQLVHYLCASRKSMRSPSMHAGIPFASFVEQLPNLKCYSAASFIDLCLVSEEYKEALGKYYSHLPVVTNRRELASNDQYCELFEVIRTMDYERHQEQYSLFRKYLEQNDFVGDVAIVDVGWRASAQFNLQRICEDTSEITGYYFGFERSEFGAKIEEQRINSFFWKPGFDNYASECILNGRKALVECMFLSTEGSTVAYRVNEMRMVAPVKERPQDNSNEEAVRFIQEGALQFIREFNSLHSFLPDFSPDETAAGIVDFMLFPTKGEMVYGDVQCENHRTTHIAKPKNKLYYCIHPQALANDFMRAEWKVGFLKRLFPIGRCGMSYLNRIYERYRHK